MPGSGLKPTSMALFFMDSDLVTIRITSATSQAVERGV